MPSESITPVLVEVIDVPTAEMTVGGFLLNVFGLAGILILTALCLGALAGVLLILLRTRYPRNALNGATSDEYRLNLSAPEPT